MKISCAACDRRNCLLSKKYIRRLLVNLLGCNYWLDRVAGYIPDEDRLSNDALANVAIQLALNSPYTGTDFERIGAFWDYYKRLVEKRDELWKS